MVDDDRCPTGIYGLDDLVEGGFPRHRTVLVSGACGTGKSIFSMQFLYRGALEYNEPGVFVSFDEPPVKIRSDMLRFGWNIAELEKADKLTLVDAATTKAGQPSQEDDVIGVDHKDFDKLLVEILTTCRRQGAKRLVIDSIPAMGFQFDNENEARQNILRLAYLIGRSGITSIMTTEIPEQSFGSGAVQFSKYGVEEFVSDGVIIMNFLGFGAQAARTIHVRKMRGTNHSLETHPMDITEKGVTVRTIDALK